MIGSPEVWFKIWALTWYPPRVGMDLIWLFILRLGMVKLSIDVGQCLVILGHLIIQVLVGLGHILIGLVQLLSSTHIQLGHLIM